MLLIDTHEPTEIEELLKQSVPVSRAPLNQTGMSDYYFGGADNRTRQFSRKQAGELLSDIDEAERQLRDYYPYADENYQIIEGIISQVPLAVLSHKQYYAIKYGKLTFREILFEPKARTPPEAVSIRSALSPDVPPLPSPSPTSGYLYSYSLESVEDKHGDVMGVITSGRSHKINPSLYYAWISRLQDAAIKIVYTNNQIGTATALASIYNNCQKPPEEHTTLQRYIRPKVVIKKFNPFILSLMSLSIAYKIGIGEDKATAIAEDYGSILDLAMSNIDEISQVKGIGKRTAKKLLESIGREI